MPFEREYWNQRYVEKATPWDLGQVSLPLSSFLEKITDTSTKILIPGAGRSYEAVYLHSRGFYNVFVCDWAPESFSFLLSEIPDFPPEHMLVSDFFQLHGSFDIILEQTFFCAIEPDERPAYAKKAHELLKKGGILVGVLFATNFQKPGPPFGGTAEEYRSYFQPFFDIEKMEKCYNSIAPRAGNELFINMVSRK